MRFVRKLDIIFKNVVTSGSKMFSPFERHQMSLGDNEDDSKKELQGAITEVSMEVSTDLKGIYLTTSTQPSAPSTSGSSWKRKRGEGSNARKKKKMSALKQIADAMSVIATASNDRAHALKDISSNNVLIKYVYAKLWKIPEIAFDRNFRRRCYNMIIYDRCRDVFEALKENKDDLLDWLQYHAYNTSSWQESPKD